MGCIIYELCTGKRPFEANNQPALALKIVMGKYESIPSHYSSDLTWVVKSCLSVDYKRRPSASYLLEMAKIK
jgi:NIMA (never in mitosis gene a)-related kinase